MTSMRRCLGGRGRVFRDLAKWSGQAHGASERRDRSCDETSCSRPNPTSVFRSIPLLKGRGSADDSLTEPHPITFKHRTTRNTMQAVKTFLKEANKGDSTEVCSEVAPEVVQEHIRPQEHVERAEAIDTEKHIHHHQHRVQPVEDHRVLETKHVEQTLPVLTREHKEEMNPEHKMKLDQQRTMHHSEKQVSDVERSAAHVGTHSNEHVHHHIHETITPVVQRETVQPTTVHTVQPIHQVVHEAPIVHEATTLPTISLDELRAKAHDGPHLHKDGDHTHQFYEGAPRVGGANDSTGTTGTGHSSHTGTGITGNTGSHTGTGITGNTGSHTGSHTGTGIAGAAAGAAAKHEHNKA